MNSARLNVFQRLVREWEGLHPYNGAQLMRVVGDVPSNIEAAWGDTLRVLGLGHIVWEGPRFHHRPPLNGEAKVAVHPSDVGVSLEALMSEELNHVYGDGELPLRPFIVWEAGSFWIGIGYRHWVADSVAVRRVLREWFARACAPELACDRPLQNGAGGYWSLFGPGDVGGGLAWTFPRGVLGAATQTSRMKRVQRVETRAQDFTSAFSLTTMPPGSITRIHAWAKAHRCKVNDVLLAALAEAVAAHGPLTRTSRRQDMAMGTIVDLRSHASRNLEDVFGMYLGFTTVFLRPRHYRSFDEAVRRVAASNAIGREQRVAPASLLRMAAGILSHRILRTPKKTAEFYRKRMPLSGGISNVNLKDPWIQANHPGRIIDYVRVSPTGPMMPIVVSATTLGDHLQLGLTRRAAVVDEPMGRAVITAMTDRLSKL